MKTLAMLLLCGTLATYAQNAAGNYTAGTDALATVTEEEKLKDLTVMRGMAEERHTLS